MVFGKAVGKASQTLFFLSPDENSGHKAKVLFVLKLNKSPKRANGFGPFSCILISGTPAAFLHGAEGRTCTAVVVDVATPPASQGGADMLEKLSHALCFPRSSQRRERLLCQKQTRCCGLNHSRLQGNEVGARLYFKCVFI